MSMAVGGVDRIDRGHHVPMVVVGSPRSRDEGSAGGDAGKVTPPVAAVVSAPENFPPANNSWLPNSKNLQAS